MLPTLQTFQRLWPQMPYHGSCCRQLLPLVVRDAKWCLASHADFPLDFQEAVKTFLLINSHRGFGQQRCNTDLQLGARHPGGIYLPEPLLHHIFSIAGSSLPRCVRQLVEFAL